MTITLYELTAADENRRFSPYCWRIRLALKHKNLSFESKAWRLTDKEAIAFSGQGKVPVLVHDGHTVSDSTAIAFYLENAFPDRPSLFGGEGGRALTRFCVDWTDNVVHPAVRPLLLKYIHDLLRPEDQGYFRQSREAQLGMTLEEFCADPEKHLVTFRRSLTPVRAMLQHQPFIGGEAPLYADYCLLGAFMWAHSVCTLALLEQDDPVADWRSRMFDRLDDDSRALKFHAA